MEITWKFSVSTLRQKLIYILHFPQGANKTKPHKQTNKHMYLGKNTSSYGEQNHFSEYCTILLLVFQKLFFHGSRGAGAFYLWKNNCRILLTVCCFFPHTPNWLPSYGSVSYFSVILQDPSASHMARMRQA